MTERVKLVGLGAEPQARVREALRGLEDRWRVLGYSEYLRQHDYVVVEDVAACRTFVGRARDASDVVVVDVDHFCWVCSRTKEWRRENLYRHGLSNPDGRVLDL